MRILYLTGQIAQHGGIERVSSMKINYLAETGHDVFLSTYEQKGRPFVYPISEKVHYEDLGIGYDVDFTKESLYSFRQLRRLPKHIRASRRCIKDVVPDVIIVPNFGYEYWFLPFIKGRAKIIREFHSSQFFRHSVPTLSKQGFKLFVDGIVQRFYEAVVVLTPEEKDFFKYKKNVIVIPNPIVQSAVKSDQTSHNVVTIGRVSPVKQYEDFIEVARMVLERGCDADFLIYGDGGDAYKQKLQTHIDSYGISSHVKLMGYTNDTNDVLSKAAICVCTSKTESFGMTLLEAQECGLPVVSYDCPYGPRNIIHNDVDGFLVKMSEKESMCDKICLLLNNEQKRKEMARAAENNASKFHISAIMKMWLNLFNSVI